jgi:hypothetical protein
VEHTRSRQVERLGHRIDAKGAFDAQHIGRGVEGGVVRAPIARWRRAMTGSMESKRILSEPSHAAS